MSQQKIKLIYYSNTVILLDYRFEPMYEKC